MALNQDFKDLLEAFAREKVSYLLIGGYAVAFHSRPRFTKDIDIWIENTPENLRRAQAALTTFGAPGNVVDAVQTAREDEIVYMGAPPVRVDLFKSIPGVGFKKAYANRAVGHWEGIEVCVIGRHELIQCKRATSRPQDLIDIDLLEKLDGPEGR